MTDQAEFRVVAVGGGHGAAVSLQAMRRYATRIDAVISVADDGGSSGRLRAEMPELPAPGDVRRCLGALADPTSRLATLLEHRFDPEGPWVGHAYGNLLLAALTFGLGSFTEAAAEVGRMTGGVGRVFPATVGPVALACTPLDGGGEGAGERIVGQVAVANTTGPRRLELVPPSPRTPPEAAEAILAADQVVIGPGSLFTSVLAAAIAPEVRTALQTTSARRVYVANLRAQVPEADGFTVGDHVRVLLDHGVPVDVVLAHRGVAGDDTPDGIELVEADVAGPAGKTHLPEKLAEALAALLD